MYWIVTFSQEGELSLNNRREISPLFCREKSDTNDTKKSTQNLMGFKILHLCICLIAPKYYSNGLHVGIVS